MVQMRYICNILFETMVATKTATLNLRIDPHLKDALRTASLIEHRSIANMVEVMIREHCSARGITVLEQQEMFSQPDTSSS
jgi:hypothetical protein